MNQEIRVLLIIDSLGLGGAQSVVKGMCEYECHVNYILFSLRKRKIQIRINNPNVIVYPSHKKYSFSPIKDLISIIDKNNIHIIHCQLFRSIIFGCILKKFFFPNIKLIVHEQGKIFKKRSLYPIFIRVFKNEIDRFISITHATTDLLVSKSHIPPHKISLLNNFVDLDRFKQSISKHEVSSFKNRYNIPNDVFIFGFAARLIKRKGWKEFMETGKLLNKKYPNVYWIIAGDGLDKERMLKDIKEESNIIYLGYQADMPMIYSCMNCFVIPSHWEPMGITEIEAQAMGIPVIASDTPGLNEVIQDSMNGLLFRVGSSGDLAAKMEIILNDEKIRNKLIKGGSRSVKDYSLDRYMKFLYSIYESLLNHIV